MMERNKDRIRQSFARAAETYDSQAVIQLRMAENLLCLLDKYLVAPPARVLEIGCCTGLLTQRLANWFGAMQIFYVNDLVPDFQKLVEERLHHDSRLVFLPGDIETIDLPENLDLVVTSSTLHWLADLPVFFTRIASKLAPGGTLCFSIYGPDNLHELREITGIGLDYASLSDLEAMLGENFDILASEEERRALAFEDPLDLLNHLRETGVNALDPPPWTRTRLEYFRQEYTTRFKRANKVILTYHPIYCIARKKR